MPTYKTYLVSYPFERERWSFELYATSHEEARARLRAMAWGRVDGELVETRTLSWFERLRLWWAAGEVSHD